MSTTTTTNTTAEAAKTGPKNFRSNPDVENFYRFVNDNGLRREAKIVLEAVAARLKSLNKKKSRRGRKSKKTLQ